MSKHDGMIRGFYWSNRAWYSKIIDGKSINFGMYSPSDGGTSGEMTMKWYDLDKNESAPRLECFDDAWNVLYLFGDLLSVMAEFDDKAIDDEKFVEILIGLGFRDLTQYKDPYQ